MTNLEKGVYFFQMVGERRKEMKTFNYKQETYQVTKIESLEHLPALAADLKRGDKLPAMFHASLLLKSGKLSSRGGVFYRFTSGNFLKIM